MRERLDFTHGSTPPSLALPLTRLFFLALHANTMSQPPHTLDFFYSQPINAHDTTFSHNKATRLTRSKGVGDVIFFRED